MNTGTDSVKRTILAWMLAAIFMLPALGQYIHAASHRCVHHSLSTISSAAGHDTEEEGGHDCSCCPVCQFSFSACTEGDEQTVVSPLVISGAVLPSVLHAGLCGGVHSNRYLRGPPAGRI